MKKILTICLLVLASGLLGCNPQDSNCKDGEIYYDDMCRSDLLDLPFVDTVGEQYTTEQIISDLDELKNDIVRNHPMQYIEYEELSDLIETTKAKATEGLSELEVLRLMTPIFHSLRCGHSYIGLSEETLNEFGSMSVFFPLGLNIYQNELFVINNYAYNEVTKGSKIIDINGVSAEEIIDSLYMLMSSDGYNTTFIKNQLNNRFFYYYTLLLSVNAGYYITYELPDSTERVQTYLEGKTLSFMDYITDDYSYSLKTRYEDKYAVLTIPTFSSTIYSMSEFYDFIDAFFLKVNQNEVQNIIIDLRGNTGGDPYYSSYLFRYISLLEQPYFVANAWGYDDLTRTMIDKEPHYSGEIYVLIDGSCFSSTGHLLSLIKYQDIATIVGEESGGSFFVMDASKINTLESTNLKYKLSTHIYKTAVEGIEIGRGILPDYEVIPTIEDIINYNDPVMQFTIELIEN